MLQRYVPFAAVAAANCVNIPLMRQSELINGIAVYDDNGNAVTESRVNDNHFLKLVIVLKIEILFENSWQLPKASVKLFSQESSWPLRE